MDRTRKLKIIYHRMEVDGSCQTDHTLPNSLTRKYLEQG